MPGIYMYSVLYVLVLYTVDCAVIFWVLKLNDVCALHNIHRFVDVLREFLGDPGNEGSE